jgi:[ribosomal protein S5]-alanine N-acetyltransferase
MRLVAPDLAILDAALEGDAALARALRAEVAPGWKVFPDALQPVRDAVAADPASVRWGARLFLLEKPPTLVGWGGFKGPPRTGSVELGYAIAPGFEGRGLATAAVREMVRDALAESEVQAVVAHTLPERNASVGVLEKVGFRYAGEADGTWRFRLQRGSVPTPGGS